jgi:hypothetical protein
MSVDVREVRLGGNLKPFLDVVDDIYRGDPNYIRPLDMMVKDRLHPRSPFFQHAEGTIFLAYKGDRCVGRITAHIDHEHLARHKDQTGFFGFFDTIDDQAVADALLNRASQWLKDRGMKRIRGPLSLGLNDEVGCLVDGFDYPPMIMMPHHLPYQSGLIESNNHFERIRTMYAWKYEVGPLKRRVQEAHDELSKLPEVTSRPVDMNNIEYDTRIVMNLYNDAWSENWGHVPMTQAELRALAKDFKLLLRPELTQIAFINGTPAAVAIAAPNLNETLVGLNGKLFPTGALKLLYRLKIRKTDTARLIILGIAKRFRSQRKYAALSLYLYAKLNQGGQQLGIKWGELSYTDEANGPVNTAIKMMGGTIYKRYNVYERDT